MTGGQSILGLGDRGGGLLDRGVTETYNNGTRTKQHGLFVQQLYGKVRP